MTIIENYKSVISKYAQFEGKATRSEYWYFFLANLIIGIVLSIVSGIIGDSNGILGLIYSLIVFLPSLAVAVRRLHDTNRSGWWVLIVLLPFIGWIWFFILMVLPSANTTAKSTGVRSDGETAKM